MTKKTDKDLRIVEGVVNAQLAERDAEIAQLKAQVAELQAALNNTPLDTLRRYFHGTMQIDGIYSDDEYLVDSDMIERWFKDMD